MTLDHPLVVAFLVVAVPAVLAAVIDVWRIARSTARNVNPWFEPPRPGDTHKAVPQRLDDLEVGQAQLTEDLATHTDEEMRSLREEREARESQLSTIHRRIDDIALAQNQKEPTDGS